QKIRLTDEALKSAEEDLKLTQEKYNLGAASMLELLDANVSYKTAKSNQVQSLYDYNLALAKYEKAIDK
ncbi:MAG: TolC family protein, partial [candidate division Zixibacteria bacterium]|nr:TolC family protein [candidate division Zixibacteria bacterium]